MGMFTSVLHPVTGYEIQFKCGWDDCATYRVGDKVDWWVCPRHPMGGRLLDDVYDGEACYPHEKDSHLRLEGHYWIVIKDHIVASVEPAILSKGDAELELWGVFRGGMEAQRAWVAQRYGVQPSPVEWWSEKCWADWAKQQAAWKQRRSEWEAEEFGMDPRQRAICAVNRFTRDRMQKDGFFRKIMTISEEPCPTEPACSTSSPA